MKVQDTAAPHALFWLAVPLLPLVLSGVVRAGSGCSLTLGLVVGILSTLMLLVGCRRAIARKPDATDLSFLLAGAAASAALLALLFRSDLGMLVTVGSGDAGNHVSLAHAFETERHGVYEKFVAFYAVTAWLRRLFGLTDAQSFGAGFFLVAASLPLITAAAAAAYSRACAQPDTAGRHRWAHLITLAVLAALLAVAAVRLFGPWLHYHQADGFYAHLFGLLPLGAAWLAYATPREPVVRLAVLIAAIGVQRFTYGLNLGDWLVAGAVCCWLEARLMGRPAFRWAARITALLLVVAAAIAFRALWPLTAVEGGFVKPDLLHATAAFLGLLAVVAIALRYAPRASIAARLCVLPLAFGGCSAVVLLLCKALGVPDHYYFLKYPFHAQVWLSAAAIAIASSEAGAFFANRRARSAALALASVGLLVLTMTSTRAYWRSFKERAFEAPPFQHIDALADPPLLEHATRILKQAGAKSGGVLDPSWPRANFLNASLGSWDSFALGYQRWTTGFVEAAAGHCAFWVEGTSIDALYAEQSKHHGPALTANWTALKATTNKTCVDHERRWAPGEQIKLCHLCR